MRRRETEKSESTNTGGRHDYESPTITKGRLDKNVRVSLLQKNLKRGRK